MKTRRVVIPDADWVLVRFLQEDHEGIARVNRALADFAHRDIFPWHLSLLLRLEAEGENGMPSADEMTRLEAFERRLDRDLALLASPKPNALPLAVITWHGTRELIYRVHDPERADGVLREIIESKAHPRPFDYRMDDDRDWAKATWHLDAATRDARKGGA